MNIFHVVFCLSFFPPQLYMYSNILYILQTRACTYVSLWPFLSVSFFLPVSLDAHRTETAHEQPHFLTDWMSGSKKEREVER